MTGEQASPVARGEQPLIEVDCSNLSLPLSMIFRGSLSDYERYMEQTGADGYEVTPVHGSRYVGRIAYRGAML